MENNIYELLYMARSNDDLAYEMMYEQLMPMFNHLYQQAKRMCQFYEQSEALRECRMVMMKAIKQYRDDSDLQFSNFIYLCCKRALLNGVRTLKKEHYYNNELHFSFDYQFKEEDGTYLQDIYQSSCMFSESDSIINQASLDCILESHATETEREIFTLYRRGYSYKEISDMTGISYKRVDNSLQRLKRTIGEIINA